MIRLGLTISARANPETLALPAGEFERVAVHGVGAQADAFEHRGDPRLALLGRDGLEILQRLGDDGAGGEARVERGVGILEDHLNVAPMSPHRLLIEPRDVDAAEHDAAFGRLDEAQDELADVDLPQPDSPTRHSVSPADREGDRRPPP